MATLCFHEYKHGTERIQKNRSHCKIEWLVKLLQHLTFAKYLHSFVDSFVDWVIRCFTIANLRYPAKKKKRQLFINIPNITRNKSSELQQSPKRCSKVKSHPEVMVILSFYLFGGYDLKNWHHEPAINRRLEDTSRFQKWLILRVQVLVWGLWPKKSPTKNDQIVAIPIFYHPISCLIIFNPHVFSVPQPCSSGLLIFRSKLREVGEGTTKAAVQLVPGLLLRGRNQPTNGNLLEKNWGNLSSIAWALSF